jgi:hypothetical protein
MSGTSTPMTLTTSTSESRATHVPPAHVQTACKHAPWFRRGTKPHVAHAMHPVTAPFSQHGTCRSCLNFSRCRFPVSLPYSLVYPTTSKHPASCQHQWAHLLVSAPSSPLAPSASQNTPQVLLPPPHHLSCCNPHYLRPLLTPLPLLPATFVAVLLLLLAPCRPVHVYHVRAGTETVEDVQEQLKTQRINFDPSKDFWYNQFTVSSCGGWRPSPR